MHEAKTHLSRLAERAANGEDIVIARNGRPLARLVALDESPKPRKLGLWKGRISVAKDFDAPLPVVSNDETVGGEPLFAVPLAVVNVVQPVRSPVSKSPFVTIAADAGTAVSPKTATARSTTSASPNRGPDPTVERNGQRLAFPVPSPFASIAMASVSRRP